jgi:transcriptional regulator with XRE-family HTH domain
MKKYTETTEWENDYRERIKKLMEQNNITARELSLTLGYNEGYISRILKGKIDPSFKSMMDTMLYFDISPAEFFAFDL